MRDKITSDFWGREFTKRVENYELTDAVSDGSSSRCTSKRRDVGNKSIFHFLISLPKVQQMTSGSDDLIRSIRVIKRLALGGDYS